MKKRRLLFLGGFLIACSLFSAATIKTAPTEKTTGGVVITTTMESVAPSTTGVTTTEEETVLVETETETEIITTEITELTTRAQKKQKTKAKTKTLNVPSEISNFKSYMDYRMITRGAQLELQRQAYTDGNGCRKVGEYYCIALGSYYGSEIGAKYRIHLSDGTSFLGILADQKADKDTNSTHQYTVYNNDIIEFIVDTNKLPAVVRASGSISSLPKFEGKVVAIDKL